MFLNPFSGRFFGFFVRNFDLTLAGAHPAVPKRARAACPSSLLRNVAVQVVVPAKTTPKIEEIHQIKKECGFAHWAKQTEKSLYLFQVRVSKYYCLPDVGGDDRMHPGKARASG